MSLPTDFLHADERTSNTERSVAAGETNDDEPRPVSQLKRIGKAMHEYHRTHGHFPTATILGPDGKTPHSWRVALLPALGHPGLYERYRLNEPWNSQHNKSLLKDMPTVYQANAKLERLSYCRWFALTGPNTVFDTDKGSTIGSMRDGTSNTAMIAEARLSVPWTQPKDVSVRPSGDLPTFGGFAQGGFYALLCDGSPCFISEDAPKELVRGVLTPSGNERFRGELWQRHIKVHWVRASR